MCHRGKKHWWKTFLIILGDAVFKDFKHVKKISVYLYHYSSISSSHWLNNEKKLFFSSDLKTKLLLRHLFCPVTSQMGKGMATWLCFHIWAIFTVRRPFVHFFKRQYWFTFTAATVDDFVGRSCSCEHMCFRCAFSMAEIRAEPKATCFVRGDKLNMACQFCCCSHMWQLHFFLLVFSANKWKK